MMTQAQFNVLDALICSRVGISDQQEIKIWAALAIGLAASLSLTTSSQLQVLGLDVWG